MNPLHGNKNNVNTSEVELVFSFLKTGQWKEPHIRNRGSKIDPATGGRVQN